MDNKTLTSGLDFYPVIQSMRLLFPQNGFCLFSLGDDNARQDFFRRLSQDLSGNAKEICQTQCARIDAVNQACLYSLALCGKGF